MNACRIPKLAVSLFVAVLVIAIPAFADEIKGKVKAIDRTRSEIVVTDEKSETDVTVSLAALSKGLGKTDALKNLKTGSRITVDNTFVAAKITFDDEKKPEDGPKVSVVEEFWHNFTHNLFKPLLLFFYLGFLVPILKVEFEFPYVIYQGLTIYLLLAIGWRGGEELANLNLTSARSIVPDSRGRTPSTTARYCRSMS